MNCYSPKWRIAAALFLFFAADMTATGQIATLSSPDGKNVVSVEMSDSGELSYAVRRNGQELVGKSKVGFTSSTTDFTSGLTAKDVSYKDIDVTYTLPVGKRSTYRDNCREATVTLDKDGKQFDVIFRAYNDGVAFRYEFAGISAFRFTADKAQVVVPTFTKSWAMQYVKSYEANYKPRSWAQVYNTGDRKFCAPMLIKSTLGDDYYSLVTEADVDDKSCVSALVTGERANRGEVNFSIDSEFTVYNRTSLPWRVVFMGPLTSIATSSLVENLNPPTALEDVSWIVPGLSSWDWGGMDGRQTRDLDVIKQTIDQAAEMGWPYMTLDDGWDGASYDLGEVVDYAKEKGVKVIIWTHQNRFSNTDESIRSILAGWKKQGFAGCKIDFFEDDSQAMSQKYERLLKIAGELQMVLNFHGCTKPTGRRRTYPNHLSSEAVYGNEMYYYIGDANPNDYNVNLCLTRNVTGPMEYTPGEYADRNGVCRHCTTWSGQTALFGLFESGILTVADCYDNIINNVVAPLLKVVPAAWDESVCLEAEPDQYVTMWKRSGDDYYLSTISSKARTVTVPLEFIGDGNYTAQIWKDGVCASDVAYEDAVVDRNSSLVIDVHDNGGAIVRISKKPVYQPQYIRVEMEKGNLQGVNVTDDAAGNCGEGRYVTNVGNSATVTCNVEVPHTGRYYLTLYYITWEDRDLYFQINGGAKDYHTIRGNGGTWNTDGLQFQRFEVELRAGANTVTFGNDNGFGPDLDRFVVNPTPELDATGINGAEAAQAGSSDIYNLAGQKVGRSAKGVLIDNGRKVVR